jgi:hypothetical protein
VRGSAKFLASYSESLRLAEQTPVAGINDNGKGKVQEVCGKTKETGRRGQSSIQILKWEPPPKGWVKINTDAPYCQESGSASAGIIARDSEGKVILSAGGG